MAFEMSMRTPEAVYRSPEKLARAWEMQRADRQRFVGFFGADLVVVPGDQAQERLNRFHEFVAMRCCARHRGRRVAAVGSLRR